MLPMEKSVTFTGKCVNEIIPSLNRSFVYKAKEGRHVRITNRYINIYVYIMYMSLKRHLNRFNHGPDSYTNRW